MFRKCALDLSKQDISGAEACNMTRSEHRATVAGLKAGVCLFSSQEQAWGSLEAGGLCTRVESVGCGHSP